MMKILFNTHIHAFQNPGGGEVVLLKTKEALEKRGIKVDLLDKWATKFHDYDIIHDFASLGWRDWKGLKSYGPKLVVTPTAWPQIDWPAPQIEKLKFVVRSCLGADSPETSIHHAMMIPDRFCPTTLIEQRRIQLRFGIHDDKRFTVIPNAITPLSSSMAENSFTEKFKVQDYLLFVGRLSPNKNVKTIIEAAQKTGKKLVIIGGTDQHDKIYAEGLKKLASDQVHFIDPLPLGSSLLIDAYRGARSLVVASFFETCSLVGMEAASLGIPVIMTERGATKEIYQNYASYVDPDRVESLTQAIEKNWEKKKDHTLQKHILDNYSWDTIVDRLINVYQEVLQPK